jgi:predicted alpha/beta hydrolase
VANRKLAELMKAIKILTTDHYVLSARHFIPGRSLRHTVIINPATGVKQQFYAHFAAFLSLHGFQTYTYDYRGIGESTPPSLRHCSSNLINWGECDLSAVIRYARERHPGNTLTLLGHSIGGQLIGTSPESRHADNIVMIAAQTPYWRNYKGIMRFKVWNLWHIMIPLLTKACGYFPSRKIGLFENLPGPAALQWARWGKSKHYLFGDYPDKKKIFNSLCQRALAYSFSDDPFAPREAVEDLLQHYTNLNLTHKHFRPSDVNLTSIGHFTFFRKTSEEIFWKDIVDWLGGESGQSSTYQGLLPNAGTYFDRSAVNTRQQ